jgi:tRNA(adenine34) deaminase
MSENHDYFMALALERGRAAAEKGECPTCALVVKNGKIVGQGLNTVLADTDPSAHAEVNAIRDACTKLHTLDLAGSTLYCTLESCPMCLSTLFEVGITRMVLGARHARAGITRHGGYTVESFLALTGRELEFVTGVREAECEAAQLEWRGSRPSTG